MNYLEVRQEFMRFLMDKLNFPASAKDTFNSVLELIMKNPVYTYEFTDLVKRYDYDRATDFKILLDSAKSFGEKIGVNEYSIHMLLLLCMVKKLKEYYEEQGLSEKLCFDILADLGYKLNECRMVYGIDGTFVALWYEGIYNLRIFALGRLQFELFKTRYEYFFRGKLYPVGTKVINIHIPRTGTSLNHEEVLSSYKQAVEMFAKEFQSDELIFYCDSWLLDPWISTVLSPTSNLSLFQKDFEIVLKGESYNYSALWVVFDRHYNGDILALPDDTTLRRAYIELIKENKPFYYAHGLFLYKNGEIIK